MGLKSMITTRGPERPSYRVGIKSAVSARGDKSAVPARGDKFAVPVRGDESAVPAWGDESAVPARGNKFPRYFSNVPTGQWWGLASF
jgi:hypothetical protein